MPSTSTFRIPKAEITGLYGAMMKLFAKKMLGGEFPDNGYVYFHHKPVLKAMMSFEGKVDKWDELDPNAQVLRAARQRRRHRLLVVPRLRLLQGAQRRARPRQGARGAALARVRRVHAAGARRAGVRRGDVRHAADRDR